MINRIAIMGVTGAGKSTFARLLHLKTNLPVFHTDSFIWENGWKNPKNNDQIIEYIDLLLSQEKWIIEGYIGYTTDDLDRRLEQADLILVLDYHRPRLAWHILKRTLIYHGKHRPELSKKCIHYFKPVSLFRKIFHYFFARDLRDNLERWITHIPHEKIIRFKNPAQAHQWLENFCN